MFTKIASNILENIKHSSMCLRIENDEARIWNEVKIPALRGGRKGHSGYQWQRIGLLQRLERVPYEKGAHFSILIPARPPKQALELGPRSILPRGGGNSALGKEEIYSF